MSAQIWVRIREVPSSGDGVRMLAALRRTGVEGVVESGDGRLVMLVHPEDVAQAVAVLAGFSASPRRRVVAGSSDQSARRGGFVPRRWLPLLLVAGVIGAVVALTRRVEPPDPRGAPVVEGPCSGRRWPGTEITHWLNCDYDGDGRVEAWKRFDKEGRQTRLERDSDQDGIRERVEFYAPSGRTKHVLVDPDGDGFLGLQSVP